MPPPFAGGSFGEVLVTIVSNLVFAWIKLVSILEVFVCIEVVVFFICPKVSLTGSKSTSILARDANAVSNLALNVVVKFSILVIKSCILVFVVSILVLVVFNSFTTADYFSVNKAIFSVLKSPTPSLIPCKSWRYSSL